MRTLLVLLFSCFWLAACAAADEDPSPDLGQAEFPLDKEKNWGVRKGTRAHCFENSTECYYPNDRNVRFCVPSNSGFSTAELGAIGFGLDYVWNAIEPELPGWAFNVIGCDGSEDVRLYKAPVSPAAGQGIGAYQSASCTSESAPLGEPTPLAGVHRYCNRWTAVLDFDDICNTWGCGTQDPGWEVFYHALGAVTSSAVGIGLNGSGNQYVWNYTNVAPLGKFSYTTTDLCRVADAEHSSLFHSYWNLHVEQFTGNDCP